METAKVFLNRKMDKHTVVYPYNKILLSNQKEQIADTCNNTDVLQSIILREIRDTKYYTIQFI